MAGCPVLNLLAPLDRKVEDEIRGPGESHHVEPPVHLIYLDSSTRTSPGHCLQQIARTLTPLVSQHIHGLERCHSGLEVLEFESNPAVALLNEDVERLASALPALRSISIQGPVPLMGEDPVSPTGPTLLALGSLVRHCPPIENIALDVKGTLDSSQLQTTDHGADLSPALRMIDVQVGWTFDRPIVDPAPVARHLCQMSSHPEYTIRTNCDTSVAPTLQDLMRDWVRDCIQRVRGIKSVVARVAAVDEYMSREAATM